MFYEHHVQLLLAALKGRNLSLKVVQLTCLEPPTDAPWQSFHWSSLATLNGVPASCLWCTSCAKSLALPKSNGGPSDANIGWPWPCEAICLEIRLLLISRNVKTYAFTIGDTFSSCSYICTDWRHWALALEKVELRWPAYRTMNPNDKMLPLTASIKLQT